MLKDGESREEFRSDGADAQESSARLPLHGEATSAATSIVPEVCTAPPTDAASNDSDNKILPFNMFSEEQRLHALHLCDEGYSVDEVDICSTHSNDRWRRTLAATGSVWKESVTKNSHADATLRNDELVRAVKLLFEAEPAVFLRDHVDLLVTLSASDPDVGSCYVSSATVYHVFHIVIYTRRRVERIFLESSEHEQREPSFMIRQLPLRCLVSVDETHTDGGDVYRKLGRNLKEDRCDLIDPGPRTVLRTSTMMAVSITPGVIWSHTVALGPAQTSDNLRLFLQCLETSMNNYVPGLPWDLQPDACPVLSDNAFTHDEAGDGFMQENGIHLTCVPPYSPNLMPIKGLFAELKKQEQDCIYANTQYLDRPMQLIAAAIGRLNLAPTSGQFQRMADQVAELLF